MVISALSADGETVIFSDRAICSSRERVADEESGVKRNLEHRDARGSIILKVLSQPQEQRN